jgi:hypothetical protein
MPIERTFVDSGKGKDALDIIKHYVRHNTEYPSCYHAFFTKWSLINPLYNACSRERREPCRVIDFGEKNESLWSQGIEDYTKTLVSCECVGNGKNDALPDEFVRTATLHLRRELNIIVDVCSNCSKTNTCDRSEISNPNFHKLDATMRILYQIRCNLFHGDKPELDGEQGDRNKELVGIGDKILTNIFQSLADNRGASTP